MESVVASGAFLESVYIPRFQKCSWRASCSPVVKSQNKFKNLNRQFHCPGFKGGVEAHGDAVEDVHHKEGGRLHPSDLGRLKMTSGESDRQVL